MINDVKFVRPINIFFRIVFILLILIKSRSVVLLLYAILNYSSEDMPIAEMIAGGTFYQVFPFFILCIAGFFSTFGISRSKEWGRIIMICVFLLFILLNFYKVFNIFNMQIRYNFDLPIVDLSSSYLNVCWHLIVCCVLGVAVYYFTRPSIRDIFKFN